MAIYTTYTSARESLASLLTKVDADREVVVISRRGKNDVALVSASELNSLIETAHLFRSPKNAERLLRALSRVKGKKLKPQSVDKLRLEVGFDKK